MSILGAEFVGLNEMLNAFTELPRRLSEAEKTTVRRTSIEALKEFRKNLNPPTLHHRSGHLAASTNAAEPVKDALGWAAAVGYRKGDVDAYARVQEGVDKAGNYIDSTTIRAKKRLLAIPLDAALTAAGVPKYKGPRDFEGRGGFWMKFNANLFFVIPTSGGKRSKTGGLEFLFLGVPSVKIPGKRPLKNAAESIKPRMRAIAVEEILRATGRIKS